MTASERPAARPTVQIDNDVVRVTEWRFAPGAHTGWHRHEYDYVVVPMTTATVLLDTPDGPATGQMTAGSAYARSAGIEHNVVNDNSDELVFVEIEIKP